MFTGIEFNGKHSYKDFGLTISEFNIGNPSKIKIQERVPFSNTVYDFSELYGEQEYEERELSYTFNIGYREKAKSFFFYESEVNRWLMTPNKKVILKDDKIPGYYFLAEAVTGPSNEFKFVGGSLTVTFIAYPFKIAILPEGNDLWDSFNFILDYAQSTTYLVGGVLKVILVNPGVKTVYPKINATSTMQITKGNKNYSLQAGTTQSYDFTLEPGENKIEISGTGTISFEFYKELI